MALIDVSDLLSDPDFMTPFIIRRTAETVDDHGRAQFVPTDSRGTGVVIAGNGDTLKMMPEGARVEGTIVVYARQKLNGPTASTGPDKVVWKGQEYTVYNSSDYSNYGRGFYMTICTLKPLVAV